MSGRCKGCGTLNVGRSVTCSSCHELFEEDTTPMSTPGRAPPPAGTPSALAAFYGGPPAPTSSAVAFAAPAANLVPPSYSSPAPAARSSSVGVAAIEPEAEDPALASGGGGGGSTGRAFYNGAPTQLMGPPQSAPPPGFGHPPAPAPVLLSRQPSGCKYQWCVSRPVWRTHDLPSHPFQSQYADATRIGFTGTGPATPSQAPGRRMCGSRTMRSSAGAPPPAPPLWREHWVRGESPRNGCGASSRLAPLNSDCVGVDRDLEVALASGKQRVKVDDARFVDLAASPRVQRRCVSRARVARLPP